MLALPQGEERSSGALMEFARLEGLNRLLDGEAIAFDMRVEGRFYIRCPADVECGPVTRGDEES